jgi:hypothetical protein
MRKRSFVAGLALLLQGNEPSRIPAAVALSACVPTAPMPIASALSDDPMPEYSGDVAFLAPMPTTILVPCYFEESSRVMDGWR